jgi:hypothetical protein
MDPVGGRLDRLSRSPAVAGAFLSLSAPDELTLAP